MSETKTPASAPAAAPTTPTPAAAPKSVVKIPTLPSGGGFSLDSFNRAQGIDIVDEPDLEGEESNEEEVAEEPSAAVADEGDSEGEASDGENEEGDGEDSEQALEEGEQKLDAKAPPGKTFQAKTADGKAFTIPEDAVIMKKVDGELKEIKLKDHLDLVAGELTVNQRMSKVASFKAELDKKAQSYQERHEREQKVLELANSGKPEAAIMFLAEQAGTSPVQLYRQFLGNVAKAAQAFENKSPAEIENHFLQLESQWYKEKQDKVAKQTKAQQDSEAWISRVDAELKHEGLTVQEFTLAANQLSSQNRLVDMDREKALNTVVEHALYVKHANIVGQALDKVNPNLRGNDKLVKLLLEVTDPHEYGVDDIIAIVKDVLGQETKRIASKLSKKTTAVAASSQKKGEANQGKVKAFKSTSDFAKSFGL